MRSCFASVLFCLCKHVTLAMASTPTKSPQIAASFRGEMIMSIPRVKQFIKEPNLTSVLTMAIAKVYNIPETWVHGVKATLRLRRVLRDSSMRFLDGDDEGEVHIDWTIKVITDSDRVVAMFADVFKKKTIDEVTSTINTFVSSGELGDTYNVDVSWVYVILEEKETPMDTGGNDSGTSSTIFVILIAGSSFGIIAGLAGIFIYAKRRKELLRKNRDINVTRRLSQALSDCAEQGLGECTWQELLSPPDAISAAQGNALRNMMRSLCADASLSTCKVFLTYEPGTRDADSEGFGPGLFYAAAVTKILHDHGVWCYSEMMLPDGLPDDDFAISCAFEGELRHSQSARVLVVVETEKLYYSRKALRQIYFGKQENLKLIPLRFEDRIPKAEDIWPSITPDDLEGTVMLGDVQLFYMNLNSIPSPPYTLPSKPGVLNHFVQDLQRDFKSGDDGVCHSPGNDGKSFRDSFRDHCRGNSFLIPDLLCSRPQEHSDDGEKLADNIETLSYGSDGEISELRDDCHSPALSKKGTESPQEQSDDDKTDSMKLLDHVDPVSYGNASINAMAFTESNSQDLDTSFHFTSDKPEPTTSDNKRATLKSGSTRKTAKRKRKATTDPGISRRDTAT